MTPPITLKIESHQDEMPVETVETVDARAPINARQVGTPFPHLQRLHLQSSVCLPPSVLVSHRPPLFYLHRLCLIGAVGLRGGEFQEARPDKAPQQRILRLASAQGRGYVQGLQVAEIARLLAD